MTAISDPPMLHDIDADYTPQYVKLARILRDGIESGHYEHGEQLTASALAAGYGVSKGVALQALATLAANRYVASAGAFKPYRVTWNPARDRIQPNP